MQFLQMLLKEGKLSEEQALAYVDAIKKDHNKRFASGSSPDVGNKVITYSNSGGEERFFNVNTYDVLSWSDH